MRSQLFNLCLYLFFDMWTKGMIMKGGNWKQSPPQLWANMITTISLSHSHMFFSAYTIIIKLLQLGEFTFSYINDKITKSFVQGLDSNIEIFHWNIFHDATSRRMQNSSFLIMIIGYKTAYCFCYSQWESQNRELQQPAKLNSVFGKQLFTPPCFHCTLH